MSGFAFSDLLRPELSELTAYRPTLGEFRVRLDANEAPPLLSDEAKRRLGEVFATLSLERYPDPTSSELRGAIARRMQVTAEQILVGVGSDEIIALLLTAFAKPRRANDPVTIVTTSPTFVMYRLSARARGQRVLEVPLDPHFGFAVEGLTRAIEFGEPHLVFLASPNNPTGTMPSAEQLEQIVLAAKSALVVVDEAYVDYADRDQLDCLARHENVVVLRTLSKIGFAALRVGWLAGNAELVRELDKLRLPYNLSTPAQRLASVVLTELEPEIERITQTVVAERARVAGELSGWSGVELTPSQANFLWIRTERPAGEIFEALKQRSVLVRSFHERGGRLGHQLRVTIGTPAENDAFLTSLREVL
jgi:histidinol-phosphate aminotransferase